jgi:hypothetical protein
MESTTFTALAERAGRWWTVRVPQIEGLAVQVRSLDQAEMMARRHICEALNLPPEAVRVDLRTEASMLPAVAQALQARQAALRAAEAAARATLAGLEALLGDGATFQEAAIVLGLSAEEIAEFTARLQARGSRPRAAAGAPGGAGSLAGPAPAGTGAPGNSGVPGGPRPRGDAGPGNGPPTGPTGLPQRTRQSGSQPVHP